MKERPEPKLTRREGVDGFSITLADGNSWCLALPSPRLRPKVVQGVDSLGRPIEVIHVETEFGYPLEIRILIDELRFACESLTAQSHYDALIRLASALICRAHEIDRVEAASLLELDFADLPGFVEVVLSVVTGECSTIVLSPRKGKIDE